MRSPLLFLPAALLSACTGGGGGSGADYTLTVTPVLPHNQGSLLSELDRMDLVVQPQTGDAEVLALTGLSTGDTSTFDKLPALDGATLMLKGYSGANLVAYGRTELQSIETGEVVVRILVSRVDDFAEMNDLGTATGFAALAPAGSGRFLLFGGNKKGVYPDSASDQILSFDVAPPNEGLIFQTLAATMPPRDDGGAGRICATATLLTRGDHDQRGQILVAGGADTFTIDTTGGYQPDTSTVTWSTFLFDPATNTTTVLRDEDEALVHERCGATATELSNGDVVVVGGLARGATGTFPAQSTAEIYNPVAGGFESVSGTPGGPFLFHAAAALGDQGVLVCGGLTESSGGFAASNKCDLVTALGSIVPATNMPQALIHPAMAPLPDGTVLLTGGAAPAGTSQLFNFPATVSDGAWIYDGAVWTPVGGDAAPQTLTIPRAMHQMIALPDGNVLIVGGVTEIGLFWNMVYGAATAVPCAELFNATTERFGVIGECDPGTGTGPLSEAVAVAGVALDPDYGVLVASGLNPDEDGATGVSLYVPTP